MALMTCRDLSLGYDGDVLVKDLNFEVNAGDYLCIVGENGAGKSTLMRTLLGLQPPISGKVVLGDGLKQTEIGYLPQQTHVQRDFPASVEEIGYSAFGYCEALTYVDARPSALRRVGYCAFLACSSLSEAALPDTVTEIEDNAFDSCPSGLVIRTGSDSVAALCESLGLTVAR